MQLTEANLHLEKVKYSKSHSENHTTRLGKKVKIKLDQIWQCPKLPARSAAPNKIKHCPRNESPFMLLKLWWWQKKRWTQLSISLVCEFLHDFRLPWFNELQLGSSFPELEVSGRWYRKAFQDVLWDKRANCGKHFQKLTKVMPNMPKS